MSKDHYEPLELLGSGTFGSVRRIKRKSDDKILVWKEINFGDFSEKEKSQLVAEVNIIKDLKSPFIVRYYDRIVDRSQQRLYIIMEYCAGGDLQKLIAKCIKNRSYVEESLILKIFAQSVLALKDCHRRVDENGIIRPILHRDLKPANILLDSSQNVKAADFGLAKELSNHTRLAQTNVGTPLYMAPEVINERGYDEKTDIWSLGCIIYELAALKPPFDGTNAVSLAMKISTGKYNRIPTRYSDALSEAIRLMLQVDPKKRPKVDELEELPILQNHINRSKGLVVEHQVANKAKELIQRETALKAKEDELVKREAIIAEKELKIQTILENLEVERQKLESQRETLDKISNTSQQVNNEPRDTIPIPLAYKPPIAFLSDAGPQYNNNAMRRPSAPEPSKQVTVGGFSIHCDATPSSTYHPDPNKPSKLSVVAAGQGVKRMQDIVSRPLNSAMPVPSTISISDKENISSDAPKLNVLGRRGLRERRQSDNMMPDGMDTDEYISPKKLKVQNTQVIEPEMNPNQNDKVKYVNVMNVDKLVQPQAGFGGIARHRMPPPPPLLLGNFKNR